ncbi:hypothetical protein CBM2592_A190107 [Cupriavidus taiwanensis]|nr:hypothetical protein CBM2588_A150070 [Cupriavidus taiwanensis]SOY48601.1 hypothetical protein CBM2592_A190107 [Cupriavidus taiwanensis]SOY83130.1 hypothetical protein CBM2591_A230108 [Cupriavidus taiwanensis]SPA13931.1 hypothetical protein CBM2631_A210108 [Cupriavidus taiwanensis]SPA45025.1 hypothetical protein CBM2629_A180021 [Cupriavidus taiwanensis]
MSLALETTDATCVRPLTLAGAGWGEGRAPAGATVFDKTASVVFCGSLLNHASPRPSPHEGRGRTHSGHLA